MDTDRKRPILRKGGEMHLLALLTAFVMHLLNVPVPAAGHGAAPPAAIQGGSSIDPIG